MQKNKTEKRTNDDNINIAKLLRDKLIVYLKGLKMEILEKIADTDEQVKHQDKTNNFNMKILHGVYEVANQMRTITRALNNVGGFAKTLCYYPTYLKYESDYIIDLGSIRDKNEMLLQTRRCAEQLIPEFDIFHFHFGTTLTLDFSDLPVMKKLGKKMLTHYWGSEIRMYSRAIRINPYVKVKTKDEDWIKKGLDIMSNYVPHCMVGDYELYEYVKDYFDHVHVVPAIIDLSKYKPDPDRQKNEKFLIVHAPTSPEIKGSQFIVKAINELENKYDLEFKLIQGMSHEEAKKTYQKADLIVDELHCGTYGLLTIETMAMGKPVITWICDHMKEKYPADLPVISANPDTVKDKIEYALKNRDMLKDLGDKGRRYVEQYHDMNKVVHQIVDVYQKL